MEKIGNSKLIERVNGGNFNIGEVLEAISFLDNSADKCYLYGVLLGNEYVSRDSGIVRYLGEAIGLASVDEKKEKARWENLAMVDELTGLGNRRALEDKFNEEFSRFARKGVSFAVMMADIDYFKKFNDMYGHEGGDVALKTFAKTISDTIRPMDGFYRYGGEEFCGVFSDVKGRDAYEIANKLRRKIEKTKVDIDGKDVGITFSGGVYVVGEGDSLMSSLGVADEALYKAKESGRNQICLGRR